MNQLDRRKWLKIAGITGTLAWTKGFENLYYPFTDEIASLSTSEYARLNFNENPFAPSQKARDAVVNNFAIACRYPGQIIQELELKIAEKEGLEAKNIVVAGGSREGLKATGLIYGLNGKEIITCIPTYYALMSYAAHFGAYINQVPLNANLEYDLDEMDRRISHNTSMVFICNPNNPTGTILDPDNLKAFCEKNAKRTMVFVDEVYKDYIDQKGYPSMNSLIQKGMNVIISRTFSKIYGLAGMRVGYMIAREDIAGRIRKALQAGSNVLAASAALASLEDEEFFRYSLKKNNEAKDYVYQLLDKLNLRYVRSHANFVFFHSGKNISKLIDQMKEKKVLIGRPFPPLLDWCRISTGKMEDMERFGKAMKAIYS